MSDASSQPPVESETLDDIDLSAYHDGELTGAARQRAADALSNCRATAQREEAFGRVDAAVKRYADAVAAKALPSRLCVRRMAAARRSRVRRRLATGLLASLVLFAGIAGGWIGHGYFHRQTFATRSFVEDAAAAHHIFAVEIRHPVEVVREERSHLVGWLSKRLAQPVKAPSLAAHGFELIGGRLLPTRYGAPAAQLMYQDVDGRRVTFYVARNDKGVRSSAIRFFKAAYAEGETAYWVDRQATYALTGELGRESLLLLANALAKAIDDV